MNDLKMLLSKFNIKKDSLLKLIKRFENKETLLIWLKCSPDILIKSYLKRNNFIESEKENVSE